MRLAKELALTFAAGAALTFAFAMPHEAPTVTPDDRSAAAIELPASLTETLQAADETIPPCETEDSNNCYWDAETRGNGQGRSFITWDGVTYYAK